MLLRLLVAKEVEAENSEIKKDLYQNMRKTTTTNKHTSKQETTISKYKKKKK